jgi:riboflavin biosynthesis pyrimidine reductase
MPDSPGGPPLTLLGSDRQLDEGDLPQLYGYPEDHDGVWVRSNFITSLDGGATADGTSGTMAGPGDKLIFNQLRVLSDVILVGAGTVRIEGYSGAKISVAQRQQRQARNQTEVPPIAIVTKSGALDRDLGVFTKTEVPPLVLTAAAVADETRHRLAGLADIIDCSADDPAQVDEAVVLAKLAARGLTRILTEGGPMLHGSFIDRGLLDELCLTIAPFVVGGLARRIATGPGQVLTRMRCAHMLTDDAGYLYARYTKA